MGLELQGRYSISKMFAITAVDPDWRQQSQGLMIVLGNFCFLGNFVFGASRLSPTAVNLQGHHPEASCFFMGNSLKF